MIVWSDIGARARGLATHLLPRVEFERLAARGDEIALAVALGDLGYRIPPAVMPLAALELAVRRRAAAALGVLARWMGTRAPLLAVVFEDEDRRALRAILRGALQGAPPEARLAGVIPTPSLPERALGTLAALPSAQQIAALLAAWRHPYGEPLLAEAREAQPDPLWLDLAVNRTFARRAGAAARRGRGGAELKAYVAHTIDVENTMAALILAQQAGEIEPAECFLEGGRRLDRASFLEAVREQDWRAACVRFAAAFAGTRLGGILGARAKERELAGLEIEIVGALIAELRHRARVEPLGPAPVLGFALRLRAEVMNLQRVIWGAALHASPEVVGAGLVAVP